MRIRDAKTSDLQVIADIQLESWQDTYTDALPKDYLLERAAADLHKHWREAIIRDDDLVLVADNREIIGFMAVWCRPCAFIDNLHVLPAYRSQKIGFALMKHAVQRLRDMGKKRAYLWVFISNRDAIRFYEKLGGVRTDEAGKWVFGHEVPSVKMVWDDITAISRF